jgi:hypothetical protein
MFFIYSMYKHSNAVCSNGLCQKPPIPGAERIVARETREGWPLLSVETEANGDLWSTNERGSSFAGSFGSSVQEIFVLY